MPAAFRLAALVAAGLLSGCVMPVLIPRALTAPPGPSVDVEVEGRVVTVRRTSETFLDRGPVNSLTPEGIQVAAPQPVPVRGQGVPAVAVAGTDLGEWAIAEAAILAACRISRDQAEAAGLGIALRAYDADAAEALYPIATCPGLDG